MAERPPGVPGCQGILLAAPRGERETSFLNRLRYYQEKFDPVRVRPFQGEWSDFRVTAADGTRIEGTYLVSTAPASRAQAPGGPDQRRAGGLDDDPTTPELALVLLHGLFANRRLPSLMELAESLTRFGPVWTVDLRGHGTSGGTCTLGEHEILDVSATLAHVRSQTTLPVVTIGFSMGAAAVIRCAALVATPDAVVAVSGPGPWRARRGWGAWKTGLVWRVPGGTALARWVTGVRLEGRTPPGPSPLEAVARVPVPVLIVHGTEDPFFPPAEARMLAASAPEPKALWLLEGRGHAEGLFCVPGQPVVRAEVDAFAAELVRRIHRLGVPPGASHPVPDQPLGAPQPLAPQQTVPQQPVPDSP